MDGPATGYKDYYYILGVSSTATVNEIQEAYQELYDRFGPHVSVMGQDPDAMLKAYKDICEAYETLTDPAKRKKYDETSYHHVEKAQLRQLWVKITSPGANNSTASADATKMEVGLTLREAVKGAARKLRVEEHIPCKKCDTLKPVQRMNCDQCHGTGHMQQVRLEDLLIPPKSAYDGQEIVIPNRGRYDLRNKRNLDLVAEIKIQQHPYFTIVGRDLCCTVPVTVVEAVLGGEIQVPTGTGKVVMKIQPLSQSGRVYRLKGIGLGGGDVLMTVQIVIPPQISVEELELYRKLGAIPQKNPRDEIFQKLAEIEQQNQ